MNEARESSALARAAIERYGQRLDAEQTAQLIEFALHVEAAINDLREFELDNADEPEAPFAASERPDL